MMMVIVVNSFTQLQHNATEFSSLTVVRLVLYLVTCVMIEFERVFHPSFTNIEASPSVHVFTLLLSCCCPPSCFPVFTELHFATWLITNHQYTIHASSSFICEMKCQPNQPLNTNANESSRVSGRLTR